MSIPETRSLTTQGQISWDNLAKQVCSFSVDVLRRISNAGVDAYTLTVGQAICQHFKLAPKGRENVSQALSQLRVSNSWGNVLQFGFGIISLPCLLGKTDQGTCLLSLAAAISEAYSPEYSGEVLFQMVASLNAPEEFTPSMSEWFKLASTCAGALTATGLGTLAGEIIHKCEEVIGDRNRERYEQDPDLKGYSVEFLYKPIRRAWRKP